MGRAGVHPARIPKRKSTIAPKDWAGGVVAAAHPLAAAAGAAMLARGGHAVDAAIAASAVLGVVEPFGSGLGGGGFLLVHDVRTGETTAVDGRETAPGAASVDMFLDPAGGVPYARAVVGSSGLGIGAPGQVHCWAEAVRRWGRLDLATLLGPAIRAARDGFAVSPYFVREVAAHRHRLARDPASARRFLPGGHVPPVGWRLAQPDLAATLELLAGVGAEAWCRLLAPEIAAACAAPLLIGPGAALRPVRLTADDVAGYRPRIREPMSGTYRGYRIMAPPAPGAGPTVLQVLQMLDRFDLAALGGHSPRSIHLLAEAFRVAEADRMRWIADPDHVRVPQGALLSPSYAAVRRRLIVAERAAPERTPPGVPLTRVSAAPGAWSPVGPVMDLDEEPDAAGTTHVAAIDAEGNAVAYTATLGTHFGAAITVPGRGYLLNNALRNFRFDPRGTESPNLAAPGKRPRSSMAPALVFGLEGSVRWALGAAGAAWIVPVVVQLLVSLIDWGLAPDAAVAASRAMPEQLDAALTLEPALFDARPDLVVALERLGHPVVRASGPRGAGQVAGVDARSGELVGAADRRRDGAIAYAAP